MAERNHSVWRRTSNKPRPELRPGQLLGIYFPDSAEEPDGGDYTHMALYTGNGTIAHNFLGTILHEKLGDFIRRSGCNLREVIALKEERKKANGGKSAKR